MSLPESVRRIGVEPRDGHQQRRNTDEDSADPAVSSEHRTKVGGHGRSHRSNAFRAALTFFRAGGAALIRFRPAPNLTDWTERQGAYECSLCRKSFRETNQHLRAPPVGLPTLRIPTIQTGLTPIHHHHRLGVALVAQGRAGWEGGGVALGFSPRHHRSCHIHLSVFF